MDNQISHYERHNISQSNELTEAAYSLSLQAKRVLWLCLLQSYKNKDALYVEPAFEIDVQEYQKLFRVSQATASNDVKNGVNNLLSTFVTFFPRDSEFDEIKLPWLSEAGAKVSRGRWRIELNAKILPYMNGLTERFTKYSLTEIGKLSNIRAIRLYECICQYSSTGIWITSPEWLAERFGLPDSQRNNFAEMKRTFLTPALEKINETMPLLAEMTRNDKGQLIFTIVKRKPQ